MMHKIFSCACALLLAACAVKPAPPAPVAACPPPPVAAAPAPDGAVNELLAFQAGLRALPQAELGRALVELNRQDASAKATVRRAMLLAALRGAGDLGRAQALLDGVAQAAAPDEQRLKPLAQFLAAGYADARRQDEAADKLNQQVREAQRRNEQLNEKLEALKNIERTMSVRPAASVPK
ncbi:MULTISPECIES: hypothetical protein [unclassified Janthinobacterium]|uniref:hypothetical protein n=1 Tax=unclassified Janthinobacterium TaxID=2610881 RepID=UPI0003479D24|nr:MULTISPECIES: hypothetical protein [unclassified Janthinobacterium]MEC5160063.1 hypothetical protein [Janthinobacterium sp. CG_S6]